MESKIYTAQELRDFADAIAADLNDCGHTSVTYGFDDLLPIIQCLSQAADMVERCEKMSLDVAIQTFQSQKDSVLWRPLDDYGIVRYYAVDCVYVLKLGMTYAFVKAKSPRLAWRKFCKDRDKTLGIKKGANND